MPKLALLNTSQLVTLAGPARPRVGLEMSELGVIPNGAMLVEKGKVSKVGPQEDIEPFIDAQTVVVDGGGRAVLPGFVDAHTHLVFAGTRVEEFEMRAMGASYEEIAAAGGGIRRTVAQTRAASEDQLIELAKRRAGWFLSCGTTTAEIKSGYGLSLESELKILRVIRSLNAETPLNCVPTFLGAHAVPNEASRESYLNDLLEWMLPEVKSQRLAEFCDVFCERGYFGVNEARQVLSRANELGLGLRIHADQLSNGGGALLAAELGAKTADHLENTDPAGMAAMRAASVQPVLLPGSVYGLGLTIYPDAASMISEGLAVVLATDFNPGSSPTPSMPMILSLACTHLGMTPAQAITASTINAAYSLNRGNTIGSLEIGKEADFALFDCEDYREIPYFFGIPHVDRVFVKGVHVLW